MPEIEKGRQFPKKGMTYDQSIKTATRHAKEGSGGTVMSMANQVRLCEGDKAAREFTIEAIRKGTEKRGKKYF